MRVRVISGDGKKELGEGDMVGSVQVYFWRNEDLSLSSCKNAEEKPSDEMIDKMKLRGSELVELQDNPKIVLDTGEIVYGCQTYWNAIADQPAPEE